MFDRRGVGAIVALAAALSLAAGCRTQVEAEPQPVDLTFLSNALQRDSLSFRIVFVNYRFEDEELIERIWEAGAPVADDAARLWGENSLRIAVADKDAYRAMLRMLQGAATVRETHQKLVPSRTTGFEVLLGGEMPSKSLVYATGKTTVLRDVSHMQLALRISPLYSADGFRVAVAPLFYTGVGASETTTIEGAAALVPFEEGRVMLVGPRRYPEAMRMGEALFRNAADGRWGTLVFIEPNLSY